MRKRPVWRPGLSLGPGRAIKIFGLVVLAAVLTSHTSVSQEGTQKGDFGNLEKIESALIGSFYDLKLSAATRQPTDITPNTYPAVVEEFLNSGWDEAVLNRFYQATRALYLTQVYIRGMSASRAPEAFEVGDLVEPRMWIIHYKGQVSPPHAGRFRFVGFSDDWIAVAVNGETVLVAPHGGNPLRGQPWRSKYPPGAVAANGRLIYGDWFEVKAGEVIDLDVAMGERPGGWFCAFLLIQQDGVAYEMKDGHPLLPIFQLAPYDTPPPINDRHGMAGKGPEFAPSGGLWRGHQ